MKKIIPFKKEINFKTNLSEIVSISLEHSLHKEDSDLISGDFIISGSYKMTDTSINVDNFEYQLPFDINMSERYDISDVNIEIDDFYYEIIDNKVLSISIDVLIDNINEKELIEERKVVIEDILEDDFDISQNNDKNDLYKIDEDIKIENNQLNKGDKMNSCDLNDKERCVELDEKKELIELENINNDMEIKSLFESNSDEIETYSTYRVYIVREGDTIENIMMKYSITKENLELYNNISELKLGDKLIIPTVFNEKV